MNSLTTDTKPIRSDLRVFTAGDAVAARREAVAAFDHKEAVTAHRGTALGRWGRGR